MRRNLFVAVLGIGLVSLGAFSFFAGKTFFGAMNTHYASHSSYKPISKDEVSEDKAFVFLITAQNCEEYVEKNLRSVLEQKGENFRVVFIDNASEDNTFSQAQRWARKSHAMKKVEFVRYQEKKPLAEIFYSSIQALKNDEIVVLLDGNDWLSHDKVLDELNTYYNDPHVWLTYSQFTLYPNFQKGDARERIFRTKKQIGLRSSPWIYSQYSTFYAGLFKRVKMRDLLINGSFFEHNCNRGIMMPMLEMASDHAVFIPDILYVKNQEKQIAKSKEESVRTREYLRHIRGQKPYKLLATHPSMEMKENQEADLFVFSNDRPMQLYSFLESEKKHPEKIYDVFAIYSVSDEKYDAGYEVVKRKFPEVYFLKQDPAQENFKENVLSLIKKSTSSHIVMAEDQLLLKDHLDIEKAISVLENTGGYGFYFSLGLNLSMVPGRYFSLSDNTIAWQFNDGEAEWNHSNSLGVTLYRKSDLLKNISTISFKNISGFRDAWNSKKNTGEIGLCFKDSRSLGQLFESYRERTKEVEVVYSKDELNDIFLEGKKIDIAPVHRYQNTEACEGIIPTFINR